jgi:hypothetical protein
MMLPGKSKWRTDLGTNIVEVLAMLRFPTVRTSLTSQRLIVRFFLAEWEELQGQRREVFPAPL